MRSVVLIAFSLSRKKDLAGAQYHNFASKEEDFPSAFLYHLREKKRQSQMGTQPRKYIPIAVPASVYGKDADLSNL